MSFLNWANANILYEASYPSPRMTLLSLKLAQGELQILQLYLAEVYMDEEREFRMLLSDEWTVFWKRREGENRLLVSHPEAQEWVATIALETDFGKKFISSLADLKLGQSFIIGQNRTGTFSNLELMITWVSANR